MVATQNTPPPPILRMQQKTGRLSMMYSSWRVATEVLAPLYSIGLLCVATREPVFPRSCPNLDSDAVKTPSLFSSSPQTETNEAGHPRLCM